MNALTHNQRYALAVVAAAYLAAAAYFAAGALGARAAEPMADVPTRTVGYADLNLNTQAGVERLYARIHNAALAVCGDGGTRPL